MTDFPLLAGIDPLEYLKLIRKLNDYLLTQGKASWKFGLVDIWRGREDVKELVELYQSEGWKLYGKWPEFKGLLKQCDNLERTYLMGRACDLVRYGEAVANLTFPLPALAGSETIVDGLVWLMQEKQARLLEEEEKKKYQEEKERWEKDCVRALAKISHSPPEHLESRVLTEDEIPLVQAACLRELEQGGWNVKGMLIVIEDFINFCQLLSRPENHILIPSGQYIERLVYTRTALDMKADMAQELTGLHRFVAWAKILNPHSQVLKSKIRTVNVSDYYKYNEDYLTSLKIILERSRSEYCILRDFIEEEIIKRQAKWRASILNPPVQKETDKETTGGRDAPPPGSSPVYGNTQEPAAPPPGEPVTETQSELNQPALQLPEPDAPPPAGLATRKAEDTPLKREDKTEDALLEESKLNQEAEDEAEDVRQVSTAALIAVTDRPVPTSKEALPKEEAAATQTAHPPGAELLYQSNFYSSSDDWLQGEGEGFKRFCQAGYYHMLLVNPYRWINSTLDNFNLTDFRVYTEAEIIMHIGNNARCGIVFRRTNTDKYSFYYFSISRSGYYNIGFRNSEYRRDILADRYSEFINQGDRVNSLMVEAIGQKITVGVNGHILETIMDNSLAFGSIGFWLQTGLDSTAEARFRDFRLYALEP